jgi:hypothetical protein
MHYERYMKILLLLVSAFLLLSLTPLVLGAPPIEGVIWGPQDPSKKNSLLFVSQDALQRMELLLPPKVAKSIRASLDESLKTVTPQRPCGWPKSFDNTVTADGELKSWKSIKNKLVSGWLIFRARVVGFTPGWHVAARQPASLVKVEVLEVFGGPARQPRPGDHFSYFQQQGVELTFENRTLCSYARKGYRARTGDEIVITAPQLDLAQDNDFLFIEPADVYLVEDGMVIVTWYQPDGAEEKIRLEDLREP